jgi:hypothetical protein
VVVRAGGRVTRGLLAGVLVVDVLLTAFAIFRPARPSTYRVTLTLSAPCRNFGLVTVGGRSWVDTPPFAPAPWAGQVTGTFHLTSPDQAVFTGTDGRQDDFSRLTAQFWQMDCSVGAGR